MNAPLAERLRPKKLSDYISQSHLIGPQGALTQALNQGLIPSMIFWGPPGVGKTTLSNLIAQELGRPFYTLSAINSGVKDVREVIHKASSLGLFGKECLSLKFPIPGSYLKKKSFFVILNRI